MPEESHRGMRRGLSVPAREVFDRMEPGEREWAQQAARRMEVVADQPGVALIVGEQQAMLHKIRQSSRWWYAFALIQAAGHLYESYPSWWLLLPLLTVVAATVPLVQLRGAGEAARANAEVARVAGLSTLRIDDRVRQRVVH